MKALVLEENGKLSLRDFDLPDTLGRKDVRIKIHTVGICGSDVHYYTHGRIGHFIVNEPMVLGHEASGTVIELGEEVTHLAVGEFEALYRIRSFAHVGNAALPHSLTSNECRYR